LQLVRSFSFVETYYTESDKDQISDGISNSGGRNESEKDPGASIDSSGEEDDSNDLVDSL